MTSQAQRVLGVLADLAGSATERKSYRIDTANFRWMPLSYTKLFRGESGRRGEPGPTQDGFPQDALTARILKTARLHEDEGLLRLGWMWVAGRHPDLGAVFFPLAVMPVQVPAGHGVKNMVNRAVRAGYKFADLLPASELEVTDLADDPDERDALAEIPHGDPLFAVMASPYMNPRARQESPATRTRWTELRSWASRAARAAGVEATLMVAAEHDPDVYLAEDGLRIVLGLGLYVEKPDNASTRITTASTLRRWSEQDLDGTAFEHLYSEGDAQPIVQADSGFETVRSPLQLNPAQERVIAASARQHLTVVSGPPGTGKSQTVVAAALHHVRCGRSVLVAAPTDAAVSALVELLESTPGPDPVVFGASMKRLDVARRLGEGGGVWFDDAAVERTRRAADAATDAYGNNRESVRKLLHAEVAASADPAAVLVARQDAPGFFDQGVDLLAAQDLARIASSTSGWFRRRRADRALTALRGTARCDRSTDLAELERLLSVAISRQRAASLEADGGLDLSRIWKSLIEAQERARYAIGEALQAATHHDDRADRSSRRAIAAVATALRSGRARRRAALADIRGRQLTEALPLWIATMRDIDDLLPMQTDLFDVVIIDEASHIDQVGVAPALLRARSALIIGDPRQLRHVSFLAQERVDDALKQNGLQGSAVAAQLDVRRQTLFDSAAAVSPVVNLDEHYRSVPHLISFSAERFYDGRLHVATRHPRNDSDDRIEVITSSGRRSEDGVNAAEVALILRRLRADLKSGCSSVGVLTPFRPQADAIEEAVLSAFDLAEIDALDLRVGTVHSFQGCQRDLVYISLAIDADAPRGSRSFLSQSTLFNVMVTRARERICVVRSVEPPESGLLADYLKHADNPSSAPSTAAPTERWAQTVRTELELTNQTILSGYPVGRHFIDIVLGEGEHAIAVICGVHPSGPDAHIARHLDLARTGWTVFEAFESRWGDRLQELTVDLVRRVAPDGA